MEGDIGALGFWLMVGMIVAAGTVSRALKEREKQAMLRALLERGDKNVTEVLAYLRERDAADAAQAARDEARTRMYGVRALAVLAFALAVGLGVYLFVGVGFGVLRQPSAFGTPVAFVLMLGIWAVGFFIARRIWRSAKQKNDAHPDA